MITKKEILTLDDVVDLLGYTKGYMIQLMHKKQIPYYKPTNGKPFFKYSEIEEWVFKKGKK